MKKKTKILAFIPARSGSKGLPGKNIKEFMGKPLIFWTIHQSLEAKIFDKVLVSTDCPKIATISQEFGAFVPFLRPSNLAEDTSPISDAIFQCLERLCDEGQEFDYIALIEPTSPLRKKGDLKKSLEILLSSSQSADSLVSLGKIHLENPVINQIIDKGYVKPFVKTSKKTIFQRQQFPDVFFPYGVIYASKVESYKKSKSFYQKRTIPYFIERWQNYEIDDEYDFLCIEAVFKKMLNEID